MSQSTDTMRGRICMVTGSTSGIGKATATGLAKLGAHVIVVGRDTKKGEAVVNEIKQASGNQAVDLLIADFSSQASVRQLAETTKATYSQLHVLVNNAFTFTAERTVTVDGYETIFAVNFLSAFLLTNLLLDLLKASAPARVVNMAAPQTGAAIHFDDLQGEKSFSGFRQNSQAKLAMVLFTYELERKLKGTGVTANCLNPGFVNTHSGSGGYPGFAGVVYSLTKNFYKTPEQGARTPIYLASSPDVENVSGKYFQDEKEKPSAKITHDEALAQRLWQVSAALTHLDVTQEVSS